MVAQDGRIHAYALRIAYAPWRRRQHTAHRATGTGRACPTRLLLAVVALFLAVELPAYLGLDPATSRIPVRPDYALHYPLLVAHILFGYRAARSRRFGDHRRWMLRSVALTFSIVLNRVWLAVYVLLLMPVLGHDEAALTLAAAGASVWTSWVVNLLVVEWWVLRPRRRGVPAV